MSAAKQFIAVQRALSETGIAKNEQNQQQRYNYRGIDSLMNTLAPILAANKVVILTNVTDHNCEAITTSNNKKGYHHFVNVQFTVVNEEGETLGPFASRGECIDMGDKGLNKAIGAAYKYWVFNSLCVPTEADADAETPEVAHTAEPVQLVGESEVGEVRRMLMETDTDEAMYCKFIGVDTVTQIPLAKFAGVMEQLKRKAEKVAAERTRAASLAAAQEGETDA